MVLAVIVTKNPVTKLMNQLWNISMNMKLTDETVEVINKDYSIRYITGDNIIEKTNKLSEQMQDDINTYKAEQVIFVNAQLDTAVSTVQAGLVV